MYVIYNPIIESYLDKSIESWTKRPSEAWFARVEYLADRKLKVLERKGVIIENRNIKDCKVVKLIPMETNIAFRNKTGVN